MKLNSVASSYHDKVKPHSTNSKNNPQVPARITTRPRPKNSSRKHHFDSQLNQSSVDTSRSGRSLSIQQAQSQPQQTQQAQKKQQANHPEAYDPHYNHKKNQKTSQQNSQISITSSDQQQTPYTNQYQKPNKNKRRFQSIAANKASKSVRQEMEQRKLQNYSQQFENYHLDTLTNYHNIDFNGKPLHLFQANQQKLKKSQEATTVLQRLKVLVQKQQFEQSLTNQISKKIQNLNTSQAHKRQDLKHRKHLFNTEMKQEMKNYEFVQEYKDFIETNKAKSLEINVHKKRLTNQMAKIQKGMNQKLKTEIDQRLQSQNMLQAMDIKTEQKFGKIFVKEKIRQKIQKTRERLALEKKEALSEIKKYQKVADLGIQRKQVIEGNLDKVKMLQQQSVQNFEMLGEYQPATNFGHVYASQQQQQNQQDQNCQNSQEYLHDPLPQVEEHQQDSNFQSKEQSFRTFQDMPADDFQYNFMSNDDGQLHEHVKAYYMDNPQTNNQQQQQLSQQKKTGYRMRPMSPYLSSNQNKQLRQSQVKKNNMNMSQTQSIQLGTSQDSFSLKPQPIQIITQNKKKQENFITGNNVFQAQEQLLRMSQGNFSSQNQDQGKLKKDRNELRDSHYSYKQQQTVSAYNETQNSYLKEKQKEKEQQQQKAKSKFKAKQEKDQVNGSESLKENERNKRFSDL